MLLHPAASQLNWDLSWDTFLETILSLRLALQPAFNTLGQNFALPKASYLLMQIH